MGQNSQYRETAHRVPRLAVPIVALGGLSLRSALRVPQMLQQASSSPQPKPPSWEPSS
jgi:hypothetical protein